MISDDLHEPITPQLLDPWMTWVIAIGCLAWLIFGVWLVW